MTSCVAPAPSCTDVVTGANPGFTTVTSTFPAAVTTVVVPDASVRWLAPATIDFRVLDRLLRRADLNTNGARLALGGD